jgi:uncharacterized protein YjcR
MNNIINKMNNIDMILYEDTIKNFIKTESEFNEFVKKIDSVSINYSEIFNHFLKELIEMINEFSFILYDDNDSSYLIMHLNNSININNEIINILKNTDIDNDIKIKKINYKKDLIESDYYTILMKSILKYIDIKAPDII